MKLSPNNYIYLAFIIIGIFSIGYGLSILYVCNKVSGYILVLFGSYFSLLGLCSILSTFIPKKKILFFLPIIIFVIIFLILLNKPYQRFINNEDFSTGTCIKNGIFGYSLGNECKINNQTPNQNLKYKVGPCKTKMGKYGYRLNIYNDKCIPMKDIKSKVMDDSKNDKKSTLYSYIDKLKKIKAKREKRMNELEEENRKLYYKHHCKTLDELEEECGGLKSYHKCPNGLYYLPICDPNYFKGKKMPDNSTCTNINNLYVDNLPKHKSIMYNTCIKPNDIRLIL